MKIDGLSSVTFEDDAIIVRQRRLPFDQIRSVRFSATQTRHSVNGIPTGSSYESLLTLFLMSGDAIAVAQDWAIRSGAQEKHMGAMQRANAIVSGMTYRSRLRHYEKSRQKSGFFRFGDWRLATDGTITHRGEAICNIKEQAKNLSLDYGNLHVRHENKSGIFRADPGSCDSL